MEGFQKKCFYIESKSILKNGRRFQIDYTLNFKVSPVTGFVNSRPVA